MKTPKIITIAARNLRKNMTQSEILLWNRLKAYQSGIKIYRQKPIFVIREDSWFERYIIADFYFPNKKLIIEIDGSIHNKNNIYNLDRIKEKLLQKRWFKITRFTNNEIENNLQAIIQKISISFSS